MIILYLILIALGAIAYRLGGTDKTNRWYAILCNTKARDFGVPLVTLLSMWVLHKWHWSLWICAPLMFGAMTTYWKVLNKFFGKNHDDCYWFNWLAHGLMIGLAFLPYGYFTHAMCMVSIRAVLMALLVMFWGEIIDNDVVGECGRGVIIVGSLWMI